MDKGNYSTYLSPHYQKKNSKLGFLFSVLGSMVSKNICKLCHKFKNAKKLPKLTWSWQNTLDIVHTKQSDTISTVHTIQYDSTSTLHTIQSDSISKVHTIQFDSTSTLYTIQSDSFSTVHTIQYDSNSAVHTQQSDSTSTSTAHTLECYSTN